MEIRDDFRKHFELMNKSGFYVKRKEKKNNVQNSHIFAHATTAERSWHDFVLKNIRTKGFSQYSRVPL